MFSIFRDLPREGPVSILRIEGHDQMLTLHSDLKSVQCRFRNLDPLQVSGYVPTIVTNSPTLLRLSPFVILSYSIMTPSSPFSWLCLFLVYLYILEVTYLRRPLELVSFLKSVYNLKVLLVSDEGLIRKVKKRTLPYSGVQTDTVIILYTLF